MKMQTPLAKVRGLGSAKNGLHHWWMQRLTAIALIPLSLWFIYSLVFVTGAEYSIALVWLSKPINAVLMLFFLVSLYYHAALGLQVVIEDYIETEWKKMSCLIAVKFLIFLLALAACLSVLKIYLGM